MNLFPETNQDIIKTSFTPSIQPIVTKIKRDDHFNNNKSTLKYKKMLANL